MIPDTDTGYFKKLCPQRNVALFMREYRILSNIDILDLKKPVRAEDDGRYMYETMIRPRISYNTIHDQMINGNQQGL
jgi:hypothetical protein